MTRKLTARDYPLAETMGTEIAGSRGVGLDAITVDAVLAGTVAMEDLRITPGALASQAEIARDAGRDSLALNFERASELVEVPQDVIMAAYELLRPGRAKSKAELLALAERFRADYGAARIADFITEAAEACERRGLFIHRF